MEHPYSGGPCTRKESDPMRMFTADARKFTATTVAIAHGKIEEIRTPDSCLEAYIELRSSMSALSVYLLVCHTDEDRPVGLLIEVMVEAIEALETLLGFESTEGPADVVEMLAKMAAAVHEASQAWAAVLDGEE